MIQKIFPERTVRFATTGSCCGSHPTFLLIRARNFCAPVSVAMPARRANITIRTHALDALDEADLLSM
jgi:hypothetical protein